MCGSECTVVIPICSNVWGKVGSLWLHSIMRLLSFHLTSTVFQSGGAAFHWALLTDLLSAPDLPFLTLAHFLTLTDFLRRETDRTDWRLKASFRSSCMACSSPVVKYNKVDGGLSHLRCGKYNFIFVFSNNYNNKTCLWKVSMLYCGAEIDVFVWKKCK